LATGPLIAALIVIPIAQGRAGLRELGSRMIRWRVRWYWYAMAVGLPMAVLLLTVVLNVALGASALSPLVSTLILAVLITGWHLPILFLEEGGLQPSFLVGFLLGTVAVTFWYSWLFNHTGGSVLLTIVAHSTQGSIQYGAFWSASADVARVSLLYAIVASAVAIGLVVFDWKSWRGPAPAEATTLLQPANEGASRVR
jgi:uncharacterized protein